MIFGCAKIELASYYESKGFRSRSERDNPEIIAYLQVSPKEAFQTLFPRYLVTRYQGLQLFPPNDSEETAPQKGLAISDSDLPKCYGVNIYGTIENLLEFLNVDAVKRHDLNIAPEIKHILDYINDKTTNTKMEETYRTFHLEEHIKTRSKTLKEVNFMLENLL